MLEPSSSDSTFQSILTDDELTSVSSVVKLPLCDDEDSVSSLIKQNTNGRAVSDRAQQFWYNALTDYVAE